MKKRKLGRKFNRQRGQRKALIKLMCAEVFKHGKIKTTEAKAKELRRFVEKFISRAKKSDLSARRYLLRYFSEEIVKKIADEIVPKYKTRQGGYTRIIKIEPRKSDSAKMAFIELV